MHPPRFFPSFLTQDGQDQVVLFPQNVRTVLASLTSTPTPTSILSTPSPRAPSTAGTSNLQVLLGSCCATPSPKTHGGFQIKPSPGDRMGQELPRGSEVCASTDRSSCSQRGENPAEGAWCAGKPPPAWPPGRKRGRRGIGGSCGGERGCGRCRRAPRRSAAPCAGPGRAGRAVPLAPGGSGASPAAPRPPSPPGPGGSAPGAGARRCCGRRLPMQ